MYVLGYRVPELIAVGILIGLAAGSVATWNSSHRGWSKVRIFGAAGTAFLLPIVLSVTLAPSGRTFSSGCSLTLPSDVAIWRDDQRMLNLLLFVPLGLFSMAAVTTSGRHRLIALLVLFGLSASIELLQSSTYVARTCDLTDLLDNSVGSLTGALLGVLVSSLTMGSKSTLTGEP